MERYQLRWSKQAVKDWKNLQQSSYADKAKNLLALIRCDPYQTPPKFKSLRGGFEGVYSRRINQKHRLTYKVFEDEKIVLIIGMWTHYHE